MYKDNDLMGLLIFNYIAISNEINLHLFSL
jgi:hypothetical protein